MLNNKGADLDPCVTPNIISSQNPSLFFFQNTGSDVWGNF